jgi:SNF2 family DNA or RNA helicase
MERITQLEDERYRNHNVPVTQALETTDIEKTLDEESAAFGAISKVRRDDVLERSKRKQLAHDPAVARGPRHGSKDRELHRGANALPSKHAVVELVQEKEKEKTSSFALERIDSFGVFEQSSLVLSDNCGSYEAKRRTIAVAAPVAKLLKQHQREAIEFMFQRAFQDLSFLDANEARKAEENISGIILAHNMGLGKLLFYDGLQAL